MIKHTYVVFGDPTPLARARHVGGRVYDSQKIAKSIFGMNLKEQHNKKPLLKGSLHLDILFYMPIPDSWSTKKKLNHKNTPHICKPDTSNLLKFVEDCGVGVLYHDDCIIYSVNVKKLYDDGNHPRTIINIQECL